MSKIFQIWKSKKPLFRVAISITLGITVCLGLMTFANRGGATGGATGAVSHGSVMSVSFGDVAKIVTSSGQVLNETNVFWSPPSIEPIESIKVKVGDKVKAGQILAILRDDNEKLAYENAKVALKADQITMENADASILNTRNNQLAQLAAANTTLKNTKLNLQNNAPVYQASVDQALNNLNTAKNEFDAKELTYDSTLQNALNNLQSTKLIAQAWTSIVGDTLTVNTIMQSTNPILPGGCLLFGLTGSACTAATLAGDYKDYTAAQNDFNIAQSNYDSAKQTREINRQNDNQQLQNLIIAYQNSLAQQNANTSRDQQAIDNALAQINTITVQLNAVQNQVLRAKVESDKIAIATTYQKLIDTVVKSPIEGIVAAISNTVGQSPTPIVYSPTGAGTAMFVIKSKFPDSFVANFNSIDGAKINVGQMVSLSISLLSGLASGASASAGASNSQSSTTVATNSYKGIVTRISYAPSAFGVTPGFKVYVSFLNTPTDVFPGLPGKATISIKAVRHVLVVPNGSIKLIGGYYYVQKIRFQGGHDEKIQTRVTLGVSGTNSTEITSGLYPGERINIEYGE